MNLITSNALTMSSQEIADLVEARHDSVKRTIERLAEKGTIQLPPLVEVKNHLGQTVEQYVFSDEKGKRDSIVVVAQLSPEFTAALVDRWQALEDKASRPMTQAEITAANANHLVSVERQQLQQQAAIERIERRVEIIAEQRVWDHCPQNCAPLGRIKQSMSKRFGLSGPTVAFVLQQWPHLPKQAGMVRNGHEEAKGSQYVVWHKTDVLAAFNRFVSESQMVTATQATNPYFEGRFRLVQQAQS
ncbi:Rha family transcriptional regulator [Pseudomonas sp. 10B1]|uniref:Rha family transcriptional regulator n=1 Tax=unclassified Pseudomonas TaxID=196821 RepID=UPI002AB42836|nr:MULTISPECIES: Rha family transcriptional regulator [unclassified Pseudomonas]MDY7560188.1 Rha family transcriptional regulator [Pseudomonas sp. AB6]MEA9994300.1 Rha family transcriptional regulator [Pseudomonas sp. AA4]MEB0088523.1 Rha family transcriptional regulator [Pseudomonas sp. RTI1]MEB0126554.1 Rha family transcriptional regulator [Pseudomonas sp. CCC1.2]MEB0154633.1 Rha family transcriptional regulator [Pseudomonas sp. CCC4.3]